MMENPMLMHVTDASFSYESDKRSIFHNVTFSLEKGEILSVLGPNGAGKTTLLNCVGGLRKLTSGQVRLGDERVDKMERKQLAKRIGYVTQNQYRTYDFSVRDYVAMGRAPCLRIGRSPSAKDYEFVDSVLEEMRLKHLAEKPYTKISGGESQQVMIARVLVQQPQIIILDEPTNHLDFGNQLRILRLLKKLASEGYGILLTTHTPDHAMMLGGRIGVLNQDGCFKTGTAAELLDEELLYRLYGEKIQRLYIKEVKREICVPLF